MQEIRRVIQPTGWSCLAACCAMLTGLAIDEVFEYFGHDGGSFDPASPDQLRAFDLPVAVRFLAERDFILGGVQQFLPGQRLRNAPRFIMVLRQAPALVIVETMAKTTHAVVWDGAGILDPHPLSAEVMRLQDYTVLQWWPVTRIERGEG